jgi:excisionase family DNA binding protein
MKRESPKNKQPQSPICTLPGRLLRSREAMAYLATGKNYFRGFVRDGLIRSVKLPRGGTRFRVADLDEFIAQQAGGAK